MEKYNWGPHMSLFLLTSAFFQEFSAKKVVMTSRDWIFTNLTQNLSYVYILLVSKHEVICICFEKVMIIYFCLLLIYGVAWKYPPALTRPSPQKIFFLFYRGYGLKIFSDGAKLK